MGAWAQGWQTGENIEAQRRARQQQLQDEQRQTKEAALQNQLSTGAISAAQYGQGVNDLYAHEPAESRLGRIGRGLERAVGLKKRAAAQQQQADAALAAKPSLRADFARIEAGAKTPEQLAAEKRLAAIQTFTQEGDIQNRQTTAKAQQDQQRTFALIDQYITDPEQNKAAKEDYVRKQAGIMQTFKNLPGAAGQPYKTPNGTWVRPVQAADGSITEEPMPAGYNGPAARPQSASVQYTNLLAKKILADKKQGSPLTNEEAAQLQASEGALTIAGIARAKAWAQAAAANNLVAATVDGVDSLVTRAQAASAAQSGTPYLAGVVSAPTGMDKKNQMLAQSALTQISTMESILKSDPNLTGPGAGQLTAFTRWIGSNSEDAQQFLAAATFLSEHGVGVFGGRNIRSIEDLQNMFGALKTNPVALRAALGQARATMTPWATAGGRLPAPQAGQTAPQAGGNVENWVRDPKTGKLVKQ